jgi:hypothetical protein
LKELKLNERWSRQKKQGKEDKFMKMVKRNKTEKPLEKFHLNAVIERSIIYTNKKQVK